MQKSSFKTRKEAGTNTTFHSQDDEIKAAKFKAKYQELSQNHDNLVREYSLLKNDLEVKFKDLFGFVYKLSVKSCAVLNKVQMEVKGSHDVKLKEYLKYFLLFRHLGTKYQRNL